MENIRYLEDIVTPQPPDFYKLIIQKAATHNHIQKLLLPSGIYLRRSIDTSSS